MKTYELEFVASALKEWRKLAPNIRDQFRKKLAERLRHPHVPAAKLSQMPNCYKIKLPAVGYRLVYQVEEGRVVVVVIVVGRRGREQIYKAAMGRIT